jgi:hypothetical protein
MINKTKSIKRRESINLMEDIVINEQLFISDLFNLKSGLIDGTKNEQRLTFGVNMRYWDVSYAKISFYRRKLIDYNQIYEDNITSPPPRFDCARPKHGEQPARLSQFCAQQQLQQHHWRPQPLQQQ